MTPQTDRPEWKDVVSELRDEADEIVHDQRARPVMLEAATLIEHQAQEIARRDDALAYQSARLEELEAEHEGTPDAP